MTIFIAVSATADEARRLLAGGPRRDFVELARATGGELIYRDARPARRGILARIWGPHIRQAFTLARRARSGDTVFADGEHVGIPLAAFLLLSLRFRVRLVMLGHLVDRGWKRLPLAVLSRSGLRGAVVVHSVVQRDRLNSLLGRRWDLLLLPYQVDTDFWRTDAPPAAGRPLIVAVGSEHRDYATLVAAVRGLDVEVLIAAGSHWARSAAQAGDVPENVQFLSTPLGFSDLRDAYARASVVVVPLIDVANQSGVTTILEAMSMSRPVITTANEGQRECISGPMVRPVGSESRHLEGRGPHHFFGLAEHETTGFYVGVGDFAGLRVAISTLIEDPGRAARIGAAGRTVAVARFGIESFTANLAAVIAGVETPAPVGAPLGNLE